jgi:uncharacterized protein (TIGR00290 family)
MKAPLVMSWSGGKDSARALHELRQNSDYEVVALLTSVSEEYKRISHHGVRESLLDAQAEAIGVPLTKVYLPGSSSLPCSNDVYEKIMDQTMRRFKAEGVLAVGFGDLFLEDLRAWREKNLAILDMKGVFPLWKRDTSALALEIIDLGFRARLSCVEGKVGPGFVGRSYGRALLCELPAGIDPCGEYGEFHSYVHDGPIFRKPVEIEVGQIVVRDGRYYADLLLVGSDELKTGIEAAAIPPVA